MWTPLMTAARQGSAEIVKRLIKAGANVNARLPDGRTALLLAIEKGHAECVDALVTSGADVNLEGGDINILNSDSISNKKGSDTDLNKPGSSQDGSENRPCTTVALLSNPTGTIVIKPEVQAIPIDDSDDDNVKDENSLSRGDSELQYQSYLQKSFRISPRTSTPPRNRSPAPFYLNHEDGPSDEGSSSANSACSTCNAQNAIRDQKKAKSPKGRRNTLGVESTGNNNMKLARIKKTTRACNRK